MKCPACPTVALMISERQGVEIDYCPQCRGVWLDRGELDKIIERSTPPESHDDAARQDGKQYREEKHYKYKKKSILHDLFDF